MGTTSEIDLVTLARTDARGFLSAFLEAQGDDLDTTNVYDIEELTADDVVDGLHITLVHSEGGGEGEGEYVERVFEINRGDETISHIRVTGYYASYAGTEYNDDWTIVYPREVTVTQYFETQS